MFDILEATIPLMQKAMENGTLTSHELVLAYLERIRRFDRGESGLNAVLELNPDALFLADALDAQRAAGEVRGPLHGIPILLKDNISTGDKLRTSAGSVALADNFAKYDAPVVERLREAGAIILGKANMTEFANYMADGMRNGYSSRGGSVLNSYDRGADPLGSSTGSAVAVTANLCAVAVGTETCGSVIAPAFVGGLVGIKPTLGRVSRSGIIPISSTLDTAGPIARTVMDAAILLEAMSGEDAADPATLGHPEPRGYLRLNTDDLRGMRIGINRAFDDEAEAGYAEVFEALLGTLREAGAELVELDDLELQAGDALEQLMKYEFETGIDSYLATYAGDTACRNLRDIVRYNLDHAETALRYGQSVLLEALGKNTACPEWIAAIERRDEVTRAFRAAFDRYKLDVMLFASGATMIAPFIGWPAATVPIGADGKGHPLGSYWIARPFDEATLLRACYSCEQHTRARIVPKL